MRKVPSPSFGMLMPWVCRFSMMTPEDIGRRRYRVDIGLGIGEMAGLPSGNLPATNTPDQAGLRIAIIKMSRPANTQGRSDMLRHQAARPRIRARVDVDRPQIAVVDVLQGHRHDFGFPVDIDASEKLQAKAGTKIFALLR